MKSRRCLVVLVSALALAGCSGSEASSSTTGSPSSGSSGVGDGCIVGTWVSTSVDAPAQAAIGAITPTGGGDGARLEFNTDLTFQIDFGPMQPVTATFSSGGQEATLRTTLAGVEAGTWAVVGTPGTVVATTDDFTTAKATAELILGETVPPIFDEPFNLLNDNRMPDGEQVGVWTMVDCTDTTLTLQSPFPGGPLTLVAAKQ